MRKIRHVLLFITMICILLQMVPLSVSAEEESVSVADPDEMQAIVDDYIERKDLNPDMIAVGYVYTATGESWYFNPDSWFYSASLYKVPLMMLLAEQEAEGMIQSDTEIYGVPFADLEYDVLANSNNHYASLAFDYLGGYVTCREQFRRYSSLPTDYYHPDFLSYSYFSARFMTDVLTTLYQKSDSFPRVIEDLKDAQPGHYFRLTLGDEEYEIAQKYGFYEEWKHTAGIVYTPNPFILTVLTRYEGLYEMIISDLALLFRDYTLQLDAELAEITSEEEGGSIESEKETETETSDDQESAQIADDTVEPVKETEEIAVSAVEENSEQHTKDRRSYVLLGAAAICVILIAVAGIRNQKRKR